jgi:hypothetical protein
MPGTESIMWLTLLRCGSEWAGGKVDTRPKLLSGSGSRQPKVPLENIREKEYIRTGDKLVDRSLDTYRVVLSLMDRPGIFDTEC